ncbi:MAG: cytochrome c3 family protein [Leptospirales bacterium]
MKKSFYYIIMLTVIWVACKPPQVKVFNHRETLFALKGIHKTIHCRECHKDGAITSLPTACSSCHPMSPTHTKNLGDCDMCHTPVTFSAAFFNHRRAGVPMYGAHIALVGDGCFGQCHNQSTYRIASGFTCSNCHTQHKVDNVVHNGQSDDCANCHSQFSFTPGRYRAHGSLSCKLKGVHAQLNCSSCHSSRFVSQAAWQSGVKLRDGTTYGTNNCSNCHTRDYDYGEDDHNGLPADAKCQRCHNYVEFDD